MKLLFIFLLCVVIAHGKVAKTILQLPSELSTQLQTVAGKCKKETDDVPAYFNMFKDGSYNEEKGFQEFVYCFITTSGFGTDDGRVLVDKAADLFPDKELMRKLFIECNKKSGENSVATSALVYKCFGDDAPYGVGV